MWKFLYAGLPEGTVRFGRTVETLGDDPLKPTIDGETFDLAIIADGGWSQLRDRYFASSTTAAQSNQPEYSGYQIFWSRVDAEETGDLKSFDGRTELIGPYAAVPLPVPYFNGRKTYMCAFFVATPESEIRQPKRGDNRQIEQTTGPAAAPEWFLPFVRELFGQSADAAGRRKRSPLAQESARDEIVRFVEAAAAKGKITAHPVFEYGVERTVEGRIVVIGDAAHMASPMTAAGAHYAMKDAEALWECFSAGGDQGVDIATALQKYDIGGVQRTRSLLRTSRAVSSDLVPRKQAVKSPTTLLSQRHTDTAVTAPRALRLV